MSASAIEVFFVHTVSVETYQGESGVGESYASATPVQCFVDDTTHLVRNSAGEEVASSGAVYAGTADAGKFTVESRVIVNGRRTRVLMVNLNDSGPLGLPDHVEVHLT